MSPDSDTTIRVAPKLTKGKPEKEEQVRARLDAKFCLLVERKVVPQNGLEAIPAYICSPSANVKFSMFKI